MQTQWIDKPVVSAGGDKIGKVVDMHVDDHTGEFDWVAVDTSGRFGGTHKRYVPIGAVEHQGDVVVIPFDKDRVKNAPEVEVAGALTEREAEHLFAYYGMAQR